MKVANSIEELIGRTPVIQLGKMADPKGARVGSTLTPQGASKIGLLCRW